MTSLTRMCWRLLGAGQDSFVGLRRHHQFNVVTHEEVFGVGVPLPALGFVLFYFSLLQAVSATSTWRTKCDLGVGV